MDIGNIAVKSSR